jgi:hypothetical protein
MLIITILTAPDEADVCRETSPVRPNHPLKAKFS